MIHNPFSRAVWAVDPFDKTSSLTIPLHALKYLAETANTLVQPVYVTSTEKSIDYDETGERLSKLQVDSNKKKIESRFKEIHQKNILPPQVIESESTYAHQATDALIQYARGFNADLIVAGTHGWSGLERFFRGSFVKLLLTRSPIPVLILNPNITEILPFDRILFATHLSAVSRQGFRRVVSIAENFHSELTVLHLLSRRERDQEGADSTAVGEPLPARSPLARRSRVWSNWATRRGVATEVVFEDAMTQVSEQVLHEANRHRIGLILLEAHSSHLISILKGSRIQQMLRSAPCPILVQGAQTAAPRIPPGEIEEEIMSDLTQHGRKRNVA